MGRAFGMVAEVIVTASVIWRVSGPDDWASTEAETERRNREMQAVRRYFIATSFET